MYHVSGSYYITVVLFFHLFINNLIGCALNDVSSSSTVVVLSSTVLY